MALETPSLSEFLNSIFEGPNGAIQHLHSKPTKTLTQNRNFVAKNNKTEKKLCVTVYQALKFFSSAGFSTLPHKMKGTP